MNSNNSENNECNEFNHSSSGYNSGPFTGVDPARLTPQSSATRFATMIPYATGSSGPITLNRLAGGITNATAFLGFGSDTANPGPLRPSIILTGGSSNFAFSVAHEGNLTAISASFTVTTALPAGETARVRAQIYSALASSSIFSPTGVFVDIPISSATTIGNTVSGSSSNFAPFPVAVENRLLMVFSLVGSVDAVSIAGTASAGLFIE